VSRKTWLLLYLTVWTTLAARLSFEFVYILVPKRGDMAQVATVVPFITFPAAFGIAFLLLRRDGIKVSSRLGCYLWLAPVLLYFLLLFATALMAASVNPAGAILVFMFGFIFGLPALIIGVPIHAIGIFPLVCFEDRFFTPNTGGKRIP
jgi:hypothetical protein